MRRRKSRQFGYEPSLDRAEADILLLTFDINLPKTELIRGGRTYTDRGRLDPMQVELRRLIQEWQKSGPNLKKFFSEHPDLWERAAYGQTRLQPTPTGRAYVEWIPIVADEPLSPEDDALRNFVSLIGNPLWDLLGGPCARCGDYYKKKTKRQKVYCSRTCSRNATAAISTKRSRERAKKSRGNMRYISGSRASNRA